VPNVEPKLIVAPPVVAVPAPNIQYIFCAVVVVTTRLEPLDNNVKLADDNSA
jgi:hypothetical protein